MNQQETIKRQHMAEDGTTSTAIYSPCEKYRYALERIWNRGGRKFMIMIMLNPSTATELQNDPTVQRCETRARCGGYDGLMVLNIFAFRATDPADMKAADDPVGPLNDRCIMDAIQAAKNSGDSTIICGWGVHGEYQRRADFILRLLKYNGIEPLALSWTKNGHPQHPLYLGYSRAPHTYEEALQKRGKA